MPDARSIKDGPWAWQSKAELARIAEACDSRTDRSDVLAVYLALTWIASDVGAETFSVSKSEIASRAGVSYRKAADVLQLLERLGCVHSQRNVVPGSKELGANTYTLGTTCRTPGTECLRLGTGPKRAPCRDSEERKIKERERKGPPSAASSQTTPAAAAPPSGWVEWLGSRYADFAPGGPKHGTAWADLDQAIQLLVRREMRPANDKEAA